MNIFELDTNDGHHHFRSVTGNYFESDWYALHTSFVGELLHRGMKIVKDDFTTNAYDQPWSLINRRNEIWIQTEKKRPDDDDQTTTVTPAPLGPGDDMVDAWQVHHEDDSLHFDFEPAYMSEHDHEHFHLMGQREFQEDLEERIREALEKSINSNGLYDLGHVQDEDVEILANDIVHPEMKKKEVFPAFETSNGGDDIEWAQDMSEGLDYVDDADAISNSILGDVEDMEQAREVAEMDVHDVIIL